MKKREFFRTITVGMLVLTLFFAGFFGLIYWNTRDIIYIIIGIILIVIANIRLVIIEFKNFKKTKKIKETVRRQLSEEQYTEIVPMKNCKEAFVFEFLADICTFYAIITGENEVHIIGKIHLEDRFDVRSYQFLSYEEFLKQYSIRASEETLIEQES